MGARAYQDTRTVTMGAAAPESSSRSSPDARSDRYPLPARLDRPSRQDRTKECHAPKPRPESLPRKKIKMLEHRFGKRRRPGIMFGGGQDGTAAFQCLTTPPQTVPEGASRRLAMRLPRRERLYILRRTRNGSPLLNRFHRRGRPKGLSLLFAVLVNELECVELAPTPQYVYPALEPVSGGLHLA